MPRPLARLGILTGTIALLACAGPQALHAAVAAAAGTIVEAAPFLLVAEWAARMPPVRRLTGLAGCGCSSAGGAGALALPAVALAALAFGPAIAGLRFAGALVARRRAVRDPAPPDVPAELALLGWAAVAATLAAGLMRDLPLPLPAALGAGIVLGALAPCATAGVALAAGFAATAPGIAAGILATAGIVVLPLPLGLGTRRGSAPAASHVPWTSLLLALALAAAASGIAPGFVNPRLTVPLAVGALLALTGSRRRRSALVWSPAVPVAVLAAFAAGSPVPPLEASATHLADAAAGDSLDFLGAVHQSRDGTTLVRYAIACCRLDATPIAVRLAHRLDIPEARWVAARGMLQLKNRALILETRDVRPVAAPTDPFVYW